MAEQLQAEQEKRKEERIRANQPKKNDDEK
jgi:hypothetical protein